MDTFHMWATFLVILCTITAYATERWSIEGISLASISALVALFATVPQPAPNDTITIPDLLLGFANPALITVLALLVIGQALLNTDALERPAEWLARLGGGSVTRTIFVLLLTAGVTSAFLNNTPVVVIFIPIVVALAAQRNFSPSAALMPLSFVGILGGMTTLIGSSTNLLVAGVADRYGAKIGFFDFTLPGLAVATVGLIYVTLIMPRILSSGETKRPTSGERNGKQFLAQIHISEGHPLEGQQSVAGFFPALQGITVRSIQRAPKAILPPFDDTILTPGDIVVVAATRSSLTKALSMGAASLPQMADHDRDPERETDSLEGVKQNFMIAEAVIAPGSRHTGRTINTSSIRPTYGTMVLGIQRRGHMARGLMREIPLEAGDVLLLGGLPEDIERLRASRELLLLERSAAEVPLRAFAPRAIGIFMAVVISAAMGFVPIVASALIGAYAVIASGCLSIRHAARSFDRQIYLMVGASLAAATAMEETGGAHYLAELAVSGLMGHSTLVVLSALFLTTAVLTNILSNNATAVLFTPIAIGIAQELNQPLEPFLICVIIAANCSFATPVGYQTNLLVLGPGRYKFKDYLKAGIPLILLIWLTFTALSPWLFNL